MTNGDPFDFDAFMKRAGNPTPDDARALGENGLESAFDAAMAEIAPRVWRVMQLQMQKDPENVEWVNGVINAGMSSMFLWLSACISPEINVDAARNNMVENLDMTLKSRDVERARKLAYIATNFGSLKLSQDANAELTQVLLANSRVLQHVANRLRD